ncbi:MAG: tRNA (N6-threonylcarbamoyladenosine(37)-N6)-methyltransferase TrmO [Desulfobacteraceae bacterium 4484_190.2]|nr:MAG: tRNA (N6-threonylcarbamoyladenosine(37)-N6)-methyltransferase TrmO [Desulfobacteraceae bacterium 4484_190.2]
MEIEIEVIGSVVSPVKEPVDENWGEVVSEIVLDKKYADALIGLKDFSHAVIIYFMHLATDKNRVKMTRRPQGRDDMPFVGIFSQRAKRRPNPVGVTAVKIIKVENNALKVQGLDAIDGTPVLDIKPYYPRDRVENPIIPEWAYRLMSNYY